MTEVTLSDPRETRLMQGLVAQRARNFRAPREMTVTEWADSYRQLSSENSAEAGQWRTSRTPYLADIMDAYTQPAVHRIVVVASSQVGKTEMLLNMLGYSVDVDPGPCMWVTPTNDNAEDFSKRRLAPMIRDTPRLKAKMARSMSRSAHNTILKKRFPGGMLTMTGSNSPANLASVPSRYVFADEIDRWAKDAGGEGNPLDLLEARTLTFYNHKIVQVSTPTTKGASAIDAAFALGTQEYWEARCPHCGEYHFVTFGDIRFKYEETGGDGAEATYHVHDIGYVCPECGCISTEAEMRRTEHRWQAKNPEGIANGCRSFWINAFSSPWTSWTYIITRFLEARDDPEKLKTVYNTLFGQLWEERGEVQSEGELADRREEYDADLPDGVLCLTCGVDTQDNRIEYEVVGHGTFGETWGIERGVIWGRPDAQDTPTDPSVWTRLDAVIDRRWAYKDGKTLRVSLTFVDSGGHYTNEVYRACAERMEKRVFAIKGKGGEGISYVNPPKKQDIASPDGRRRMAWLYTLGVDAGKQKIMSALTVETEGPRYCHFPRDAERGYDVAYFNGLVSERMTMDASGRWRWKKIPGHPRNEPLDCRNYALAAFEALSPDMDALLRARHGVAKERKQATAPQRRMRRRKLSKGVSV